MFIFILTFTLAVIYSCIVTSYKCFFTEINIFIMKNILKSHSEKKFTEIGKHFMKLLLNVISS